MPDPVGIFSVQLPDSESLPDGFLIFSLQIVSLPPTRFC
jgi:hypothetical protein